MDFSKRWIQYMAAFSVSLASLTVGTSTSWPSPVIPKLLGNETSIMLTENEVALMVAMTPPGFVIGGLISRYISDRFGRRNTILLSALPTIIGTIFIVFGTNAWYLYITRFVWGIGIGLISTSSPMYIGEIADKSVRGTLTLCTRIAFNLGSLVIMTIGSFVSYEALNFMMLALPLCYFMACLWIPESPYYLLKEGKVDAARRAMKRLKGIDDKVLNEELAMIQGHVKQDMKRDTTIKELFTGKQYRRALIIGVGIKVAQIMSGTITVTQYLGRIMQESGADISLATVLIIYGSLRFVVSILAAYVVDKVNRRPFYIFSFLGTSVSFFVIAIYFYLQEVIKVDKELLRTFGFVPFLGILATNVISNLGYNVLTFITLAEVFPLNIKAVALTTVSIFGGLLSFATTLIYNFMKQKVGLYGSFTFFGFVCFFGAVFVHVFLVETKGKSLKEIQDMLQGKHGENIRRDEEEVANLNEKENDVEMTLISNTS